MERESLAFEAGGLRCRRPYPLAEVRAAQRAAPSGHEHERVRLAPIDPTGGQVLGEHHREEVRHIQGPARRLGLHVGELEMAAYFGQRLRDRHLPTRSPTTSDHRSPRTPARYTIARYSAGIAAASSASSTGVRNRISLVR